MSGYTHQYNRAKLSTDCGASRFKADYPGKSADAKKMEQQSANGRKNIIFPRFGDEIEK